MEQQFMIKTFEVLRPVNFPYHLIDFTFFFYNVNTHLMNFHHAAGIDFIYEQERICYVFPQNEFYELLRLKNREEPHDTKYDWLLLKGIFAGNPTLEARLNILNRDELLTENPSALGLDGMALPLFRIPEHGNDIAILSKSDGHDSYHCLEMQDITPGDQGGLPRMNVYYIGMSPTLTDIINLWFTDENKELMLAEEIG